MNLILLSLGLVLGAVNQLNGNYKITIPTITPCNGFKSNTAVMAYFDSLVDRLDQPNKSCFCSQSPATLATKITLETISIPALEIKTIITTHSIEEANYSFAMSTSMDSVTWTSVCSPCNLGSNDFSAAPLTFIYLRFEFPTSPAVFNLCEVHAWSYKNYAVGSTVQSAFASDYLSEDSVSSSLFKNSKIIGTGNRYSNAFTSNTGHTCVFVEANWDERKSKVSIVMYEFAQRMLFHEFYFNGDPSTPMTIHLVDPIDTTLNAMTAVSLQDKVASSTYSYNLNNYPGGFIHQVGTHNANNVHTITCTDANCLALGAKKVIVTNLSTSATNFNNFFLCGLGILAEPVQCPPNTDNCQHSLLVAPVTTYADLKIPQQTTITTASFKFSDELSTYCFDEGTIGCVRTYYLQCAACSSYSNSVSCSGSILGGASLTTKPYTSADFIYTVDAFSGQTDTYTITINTVGIASTNFDLRCKITAFQGTQTASTSTFRVTQGCLPCTQSVIGATATSTPSFTTIAVGLTGQSSTWTKFSDPAGECQSCDGILYTFICRLTANTADPFVEASSLGDFYFNADISTSSTPYLATVSSTNIYLHGVSFDCKIHGEHQNSLSTAETSIFTIVFDICYTPAESCVYDIWAQPPANFTAPSNLYVYLDDVPVSTSFNYADWTDYFSIVCGRQVCGTLSYAYYNYADASKSAFSSSLPFRYTQGTDSLAISVQTTNYIYSGTYTVGILATMDIGTIWSGPALSSDWGSFTITIVDPCGIVNPCKYSRLISTTTVMATMIAYVDNVPVNQVFNQFTDSIGVMCPLIQCKQYITYTLKFANGTTVPSTLATVSSQLKVTVMTQSYQYAGINPVYISASLDVFGNFIDSEVSNTFDINIDTCNVKSCKYTTLIALTATDSRPQSYSIGVDNVAGQTTISKWQNTCGKTCVSNPSICGIPVLTLLYSANTGTSSMYDPAPAFATLSQLTNPMIQSSATSNIAYAGVYPLFVKVFLNLVALNLPVSPTNQIIYSQSFTVTVDYCSPLPCAYNQILYPSAGSIMPSQLYYVTDDKSVQVYFSEYQDTVSLRCSGASYYNMCGPKTYTLLKVDDGQALPATANVAITQDGTQYVVSGHTTDDSIINQYNTYIDAQFTTPGPNKVGNTTYQFLITIENKNPCIKMNCTRNSLVPILPNYTLPSNFSIWLDGKFNSTVFDSWNDTKTQICYQQSGSDVYGNPVASFGWPSCGTWPIYTLVYANTLTPIAADFGYTNVMIVQSGYGQYTRLFKVSVATTNYLLNGEHQVCIAAQLTTSSTPLYSEPFTITVLDFCRPYNCTNAVWKASTSKPGDINVKVNQGFKATTTTAMDNDVNIQCGTITKQVCQQVVYRLILAGTEAEEPPFQYQITTKNNLAVISVMITDPEQAGLTFQVYLQGTGFNVTDGTNFGKEANTLVFKVIVGSEILPAFGVVESATSLPTFSEFPQSISYRIDPSTTTDPITYTLIAIASSATQSIVSLVVDVGRALPFTETTINVNTAIIVVALTEDIAAGDFQIKLTATDDLGQTVSKSFKITVVSFKPPKIIYEPVAAYNIINKTEEQLIPLTAKIMSISQTGLMTVEYNKDVVPIQNISLVTNEELFLTLTQNSEEPSQEEQFRYHLVEHSPKKILIQLQFVRPLEITQGLIADSVQLWMRQDLFMVEDVLYTYKDWVIGDSGGMDIVDKRKYRDDNADRRNATLFQYLESDVPQQVASEHAFDILVQNLVKFDGVLQILLWAPLGLYLAGFGSMDLSWVIFNNLQIISCFCQFNLKPPQNVSAMTRYFSKIANLNFIDLEQVYASLRTLASDEPCPKNQTDCHRSLQEETYQTSIFFDKGSTDQVLKTALEFIFMFFALLVLGTLGYSLQLSVLYCFPERVQKLFHFLRTQIFWCLPCRMMIQQYMSITMAAMITLYYNNSTATTELAVNRAFSIFFLIFISIVFPIVSFAVVWFNQSKLPDIMFIRRFGSLYLSIDYYHKKGLPAVSLSMVRKLIFVFVAVSVKTNILQIGVAMYVQLGFTCYVLLVRPMKDRQRNLIEYFNEVIIFCQVILMLLLTDYVPDPSIRYDYVGWLIIYLLYFQVGLNSIFLFISIYHSLLKFYKVIKYYNYMYRKKNMVNNHNRQVDLIAKGKKPQFKVEMPKMDVIKEEDESREESKRGPQQEVAKGKKTIQEKKVEFQELMERMRQFDRLQQEIDAVGVDRHRELQEGNDWPLSARQAGALQVNRGNWDEQDHDNWNALPDEFSNHLNRDITLNSDSVQYKSVKPMTKGRIVQNSKGEETINAEWKEQSLVFEDAPAMNRTVQRDDIQWSFDN